MPCYETDKQLTVKWTNIEMSTYQYRMNSVTLMESIPAISSAKPFNPHSYTRLIQPDRPNRLSVTAQPHHLQFNTCKQRGHNIPVSEHASS